MIKLINIELKKILKHRGIYVIFLLMFIFCFANNLLYKLDYDSDGRYKYEVNNNINSKINKLNKKLSLYDINNSSDKNIYLTTKTKLGIYKYISKYDINNWQYIKGKSYLYQALYDVNYYKYIMKDDKLRDSASDKYKKLINRFENNDWKYFVNLEKRELEKELFDINNKLNSNKDREIRDNLLSKEASLKNKLIIVNLRLSKGISYDNNYLNRALVSYYNDLEMLDYYNKNSIKYNNLIKDININKYIVYNKVNISKQNNLNYQLRNITSDYEIFIVIIILLVSNILISEEFNKGTIKLLLIKPYTRNKILFSKLLAGVFMIIISIFLLISMEILLGYFMFGFSSLNDLVVVYDFNLNKIKLFNIFIFMFINVLAKLPLFLFLLFLSSFINVLFLNGAVSFAIGMLIYSFSIVINNFVVGYKIKILKYLITMNWDFQKYLFGGLNEFESLNLKKSMLIYVIYVIIVLGIMFINFNKKNIKNI